MLAALLMVVFVLLIVGVILWGLMQLPIDPTVKQIIKVVVIVVAAIWCIYVLWGLLPLALPPHRVR